MDAWRNPLLKPPRELAIHIRQRSGPVQSPLLEQSCAPAAPARPLSVASGVTEEEWSGAKCQRLFKKVERGRYNRSGFAWRSASDVPAFAEGRPRKRSGCVMAVEGVLPTWSRLSPTRLVQCKARSSKASRASGGRRRSRVWHSGREFAVSHRVEGSDSRHGAHHDGRVAGGLRHAVRRRSFVLLAPLAQVSLPSVFATNICMRGRLKLEQATDDTRMFSARPPPAFRWRHDAKPAASQQPDQAAGPLLSRRVLARAASHLTGTDRGRSGGTTAGRRSPRFSMLR